MARTCPQCRTTTAETRCPQCGTDTDAVDPLLGSTVGGRYEILGQIGAGGFGAVYKARHTATRDIVAVKVLHAGTQSDQEMAARFIREAQATSALKHPNTVRVFDFGELPSGGMYLAMEFLDGRPLSSFLEKEGPLEWQRLVHIAVQVLKSLSEAHSRGLVHRDLKPDNIFLQRVHGENDFVKVLDFGIAKTVGDQQTAELTGAGVIIGTPAYMSPEQARGKGVDARTDLYAMGSILFEGLTGMPPFPGESPIDMLLRRLTEPPPHPRTALRRPCPNPLADAVFRAIQTDAADRFASADEMAAALQGVLDGERQTAVTERREAVLPKAPTPAPIPMPLRPRPPVADTEAATTALQASEVAARVDATLRAARPGPATLPAGQAVAVPPAPAAAPPAKSKLPLVVVGVVVLAGVAVATALALKSPAPAPAAPAAAVAPVPAPAPAPAQVQAQVPAPAPVPARPSPQDSP
ncbi:MAG: protein kinase, partial [Deltaproteobacteria bacterium]|nr:protein kinase [Deltaproteobacteria bacterium]